MIRINGIGSQYNYRFSCPSKGNTLYCINYYYFQGDRTVNTVEFSPNDKPYLFPASPFSLPTGHQDIQFLPKDICDVKKVEVCRGVRLCSSTIEPIGFKIPRVKVCGSTMYIL